MKPLIAPQLMVRFVFAFSTLALVSELQGQVGDNNPGGPSGIFNGNVTTGCSYDPYTGNATRSPILLSPEQSENIHWLSRAPPIRATYGTVDSVGQAAGIIITSGLWNSGATFPIRILRLLHIRSIFPMAGERPFSLSRGTQLITVCGGRVG